jgi:septum site-determining protein MinC
MLAAVGTVSKERDSITIKGISNGLMVTFGGGVWDELIDKFATRLDEQAAFFQGAHVTLDLGEREVPHDELAALKDLLEARGVKLWAVITESQATIGAARGLGIVNGLEEDTPLDEPLPPIDVEQQGETCLLIRRTIRSGRTVHCDGHVTIFGDVNPGAQVIAGGDVIVWGRLAGLVHAGAFGDEEAVVCALELAPMQLRIAGYITVSPEEVQSPSSRPEVARIQRGQIIAEPWR